MSEYYESDRFPDAAQKTAAFFAITNIRALRRILDFMKTSGATALEVDMWSVWDTAKEFFPEEFGKTPNTDRISKTRLLDRLREYKVLDLIKELETSKSVEQPQPVVGGLQCQYCDKPVSSTSGKTLHEKTCKRRPPSINLVTGEF